MTEFDCLSHDVFDGLTTGLTRFFISIPTPPGCHSFTLSSSYVPGGSQDTISYENN